jgi:hypothetical protein
MTWEGGYMDPSLLWSYWELTLFAKLQIASQFWEKVMIVGFPQVYAT